MVFFRGEFQTREVAGLRRESDIPLSHLVNPPSALPVLLDRRRCLRRRNPNAIPSAARARWCGCTLSACKCWSCLSRLLSANWLQPKAGVWRGPSRGRKRMYKGRRLFVRAQQLGNKQNSDGGLKWPFEIWNPPPHPPQIAPLPASFV